MYMEIFKASASHDGSGYTDFILNIKMITQVMWVNNTLVWEALSVCDCVLYLYEMCLCVVYICEHVLFVYDRLCSSLSVTVTPWLTLTYLGLLWLDVSI